MVKLRLGQSTDFSHEARGATCSERGRLTRLFAAVNYEYSGVLLVERVQDTPQLITSGDYVRYRMILTDVNNFVEVSINVA